MQEVRIMSRNTKVSVSVCGTHAISTRQAICSYPLSITRMICTFIWLVCPVNNTNYLYVCPFNNTNDLYAYPVSTLCQQDKLFVRMPFQ